jgi:hypothetical protein
VPKDFKFGGTTFQTPKGKDFNNLTSKKVESEKDDEEEYSDIVEEEILGTSGNHQQ